MSRPVRPGRWDDKKKKKEKQPATPVEALLAEGSRLKQAAERRTAGREAAALFEQSTEKYRAALQLEINAVQRLDALNDLGEAYLEWSACLLADLRNGAHAFDSSSEERVVSTYTSVASLCKESNSVYETLIAETGAAQVANEGPPASAAAERASTWLEATVNSGNALAEWAEAVAELPTEKGGGARNARTLLERTERRYSAALALQNDDIETLTNLGDCLVRRAELLCPPFSNASNPTEWEQAGPLFDKATQAYSAACSSADVRLGDDLAGLLVNWGAGLFAAAQRCPDTSAALTLFAQAEEKLRHAGEFSRTDVAPRVTLGDALSAHGERAHAGGHVADCYSLLSAAVEEGYGAALRIDRTNVDARLGIADVYLSAGKLKQKDGDESASSENYVRSAAAYREALGGHVTGLGFAEWCDALYNFACAAVLSGQVDEGASVLHKLASLKRLRAEELATDPDFGPYRDQEWFENILEKAAGQAAPFV